jgi:hypothetical protein
LGEGRKKVSEGEERGKKRGREAEETKKQGRRARGKRASADSVF